jgi:nuclear transport factor 2 (NTF2) superfamily protein
MKKTFTLLAALFFSTFLFAQAKLTISAISNADLRVMVDGVKYTSNGRDIVINNLKNGNHSVKIFRAANDRNRYSGNNRSNGYQLVYSNSVFVKPQYHVDITINRFGKAFVDEQMIGNGYNDDDDEDWGVDGNDQYYDRKSRKVMDKAVFDQFKQTMRNEVFEDARLQMAKQFVGTNYFNTAQVKEMLGLFIFEENKLALAKYAYDFTADKGNYFLMNDAFIFSENKEALMKYIQNRK